MNAYIYQGDNYHHCVDCGSTINFGNMVFRGKWGYRCYTCQYYYDKRENNMPNIKITAEVDGKQVPLKTISTESFEAIKALEKPKEIPVPVARLATFYNEQRLILKPTQAIQLKVGKVYVFDTKYGNVCAGWSMDDDYQWIRKYREIRPL